MNYQPHTSRSPPPSPSDELSFSQIAAPLLSEASEHEADRERWEIEQELEAEARARRGGAGGFGAGASGRDERDDDDYGWREPAREREHEYEERHRPPSVAPQGPPTSSFAFHQQPQPQYQPLHQPSLIRPTPRRALPSPAPPPPAQPAARFAPLVPRPAHSGVPFAHQVQQPAQPAQPPPFVFKKKPPQNLSFPLPLNGNSSRRRDEHLRPAGGASIFQPGPGGNYGANGVGGGGAAGIGVGPARRVDKGKGRAVELVEDDDDDLFGDDDPDFERQLVESAEIGAVVAGKPAAHHPVPRQQQQLGPRALVGSGPQRNQQGPGSVKLVPVSQLPDRYRSIWKFGVFNAIQSVCFESALFELALLRLFSTEPDAKAVYMCPTKSLCGERARDWHAKFTALGWKVVELTGDSTYANSKDLGQASVIVTTPEKWDVVTRRWNSNRKILDKIRLLMIDECHFVGLDVRGAVLEVVVSRLRTLGSGMRFLALSATAPNIEDVAQWLRPADLDDDHFSDAAKVFKFGDEYRPCKLQKIVVAYPKGNANDFMFNSSLNSKLYDLIKLHSSRKPVLIFVNTRKGCLQAAEALAKEYRKALTSFSNQASLPWPKPPRGGAGTRNPLDKDLAALADVGVAFHHAGLDLNDRRYVEQGFIQGSISVVCATSTLAVGVNLPARMVIIKGTTQYQDGAFVPYSDSDILQMLGRAGRPQFDTIGVACIMTEKDEEARFQALVKSETMLESCLHKSLTEHINSEITLRTVTDVASAEKWVRGTFLYVRLMKNPSHYALAGDAAQAPEARIESICLKALDELVKEGIVDQSAFGLASTEYGEVMSRYYLSLETFQLLRKIPLKANMRTLLETLAACDEFSSIRMRAGEKTRFAAQNKDLKYPVAKITTSADKIMILLQCVLQAVNLQDLKTDQGNPTSDGVLIWQHASRIVKAMVDLALERRDGGVKTALQLLRSINAKAWDDSSFTLRQLDGIGIMSLKALSAKGINTISDVANADETQIEITLNRNPPFGRKMVAQAKSMPRFHIKISAVSEKPGPSGVSVRLSVAVGLVQTNPPPSLTLKGKTKLSASVCLVSSDGEYIEFRKVPVKALLEASKSFELTVVLCKPSQRVFASVSCDEIGGSEVRAVYKPSTPASMYPVPALGAHAQRDADPADDMEWDEPAPTPLKAPAKTATKKKAALAVAPQVEPRKLPNGNYACRHKCKKCSHPCCKDGLTHPPAPSRKKAAPAATSDSEDSAAATSNFKNVPKANSSKSGQDPLLPAVVAPRPKAPRVHSKPQPAPARKTSTRRAETSEDDSFPSIDELLETRRAAPRPDPSSSFGAGGRARAPLTNTNLQAPRPSIELEISDEEEEDEEVDQLASPTPSPAAPVNRAASVRRAASAKRGNSIDGEEENASPKRKKLTHAPSPSPPPSVAAVLSPPALRPASPEQPDRVGTGATLEADAEMEASEEAEDGLDQWIREHVNVTD